MDANNRSERRECPIIFIDEEIERIYYCGIRID
jgi:hypothetical protein